MLSQEKLTTEALNPQQKEALLETKRPVLILAGAGSGKTRVITQKCAYLIKERGLAPWNILAVTFTNKAAKEMRSRVFNLLDMDETESYNPYSSKALWITTFHSACGRILRREIDKIGYNTNFTIYDSDDTKKLIKNVIQLYKLSAPTENLYNIASNISLYKNHFQSPRDVIQEGQSEGNIFVQQMGQIYELYEKKLFENNALDFDDLILKVILLFEKQEETLSYYRNLFQYIMVDEFQDTNKCQYRLVKLLAGGRSSISVVGDDDQSIYSWRGADISNIINFGNDFKDCFVVKLEQNYRSTNNILSAAHSVVMRNEKRLQKKLWSEKEMGEKLSFYETQDDRGEGEWVIERIIKLCESENQFKDIAIFYRMNYQSRILEEYLRKENIPYKIFGGTKFYERIEIKDLLAYLVLLVNENDTLALKRVINIPKRGIGATTLKKIDAISLERRLTFQQAAFDCIENKTIRAADKLNRFFDLLTDLKKAKGERSVSELLNYILDQTHYLDYLKENYDNYEDRLENVKELQRSMIQYESEQIEPTLDHYLMEISLRSAIDDLNEEENFISLMTLHNSKGLEFKNVFITGLADGIFPHYRALDSENDMEEERRLFYVGITRAEKRCFLSASTRQMSFGQIKYYTVSRFIAEIHPDFIDKNGFVEQTYETDQIMKSFYEKKKVVHQLNKENQDKIITEISEVVVGQTLYHKGFGEGVVLKINEQGDMSTLLLKFPDGKRLLILKYAQLSWLS